MTELILSVPNYNLQSFNSKSLHVLKCPGKSPFFTSSKSSRQRCSSSEWSRDVGVKMHETPRLVTWYVWLCTRRSSPRVVLSGFNNFSVCTRAHVQSKLHMPPPGTPKYAKLLYKHFHILWWKM